jgi:5'-phosphate synthase pdxT subunit
LATTFLVTVNMVGSNVTMRVGVLALQGDFREHLSVLKHLDVDAVPVRQAAELRNIDGLIIPGGESTVMDKLSRAFNIAEPMKEAVKAGLPVYGTCAGLIMLSTTLVDGVEGQQTLGALDVVARRNAFGSQVSSFETYLDVPVFGDPPMHAIFIRAPIVEKVGPLAHPIATLHDGRVVAVEQGNVLGTSFHPEVTGDYRIHEYFLQKIAAR